MRLIDANELFDKVGRISPKNKQQYEDIGVFMNLITNSTTVETYTEEDMKRTIKENFDIGYEMAKNKYERPQVVLFAENITEEEKQKLIAEIKSVMDNAPIAVKPSYEMGYQDGCEDGLQGIRPQGEWIKEKDEWFKCSNCKKCNTAPYPFCSWCGADMRGEK